MLLLCVDTNRRQADEVQLLETAIRQRSEQQRKAGVELDATCQLCLKTKFADGLGHACHYCNARCCARCGGKVALRSAKVSYRFRFFFPPPSYSFILIFLSQREFRFITKRFGIGELTSCFSHYLSSATQFYKSFSLLRRGGTHTHNLCEIFIIHS